MEIALYIMENLIFPLLVALIVLYIEKYIINQSKNNKRNKKTVVAATVFLILMENHTLYFP